MEVVVQNKRERSCILSMFRLGVLGIFLIIIFIFIGINEYKTIPGLVSGFDFGTYNLGGLYVFEPAASPGGYMGYGAGLLHPVLPTGNIDGPDSALKPAD